MIQSYNMLSSSYKNFNKLYTSTPLNYFHPSSLNELIRDIKRSTAPIRIIGGIHTFNDISMTSARGTIIDMGKLNNILDTDQDNKTVTVQSGCKLSKLLSHLETQGLSLPVMTATTNISIAGGFFTGAYGSNILNCAL